jgi:hypothetical protein
VTHNDTPPSSLMDSTTSPKMKIGEGKEVGVRSLSHNISRVEGHAEALGWGLEDWQANQLLTHIYTNQTTSWLEHSWNTFCAQTSHEQTQTRKTQHNLDLGEATTFPFRIYYVHGHMTSTQMPFCP